MAAVPLKYRPLVADTPTMPYRSPLPAAHRMAHRNILALVLAVTAIFAPATALAQAQAPAAPTPKEIGDQVRRALAGGVASDKELTVGGSGAGAAATSAPTSKRPANSRASRQYIRARAAELAGRPPPMEEIVDPARPVGEAHWAYHGINGPQAWGMLKPEYATCATGRRQSPINIDESITLRGPAEAIQFAYGPSNATIVNNGHTVQVDMNGDNGIIVRGTRFHLIQMHFHHPAEEQINFRTYAMVAHLVHRNHLGQLAVVAVLLEPGEANPVINHLWTYMPLGKDDRVPFPRGSVDLTGLLPKDPLYYQFMGSLTTPPCTEDVLWMVLKQPVTISHEQLRLFAQQFPNNARPVQPINGRVVREAR